MKTKQPKWTKEEIKANMQDMSLDDSGARRGDRWVVRGMLSILKYQTEEEQQAGVTVEDNGVGFNGVDAEILTSFCDQARRGLGYHKNNPLKYTMCLSAKQMEMARTKMLKYSGQLARIANTHNPKAPV